MILLDTHIWVWWVNGSGNLSPAHRALIEQSEATGMAVSIISCWEVALLVAKRRLTLSVPTTRWMERAVAYPGVRVEPLTPQIAMAAVELGNAPADPADRFIMATARALNTPLLTVDAKILNSNEVQAIGPRPVA